ncbi:MAG: molybdenum cofactor guanylyltransferase [Verrucomicrobiota bacterium]
MLANPLAFDGVVLAAGRSTRMGRDKALLPAPGDENGRAMWQRQGAVLRAAGASSVFLSARPEQEWARNSAKEGFAAVLHDEMPGCGPMVGMTAALERSARSHVAVLAIDLPRMTAAWFGKLIERCDAGVGVVGRRGQFFEPLAAIYPRELMWLAWEALARGDYALQRLGATAVEKGLLRVIEVSETETDFFENWNEGATS